jgi:hypothetical protein
MSRDPKRWARREDKGYSPVRRRRIAPYHRPSRRRPPRRRARGRAVPSCRKRARSVSQARPPQCGRFESQGSWETEWHTADDRLRAWPRQLLHDLQQVLDGDAERLHHLAAGSGHSEAVDPDARSIQTDVRRPSRRHRRLDRHASPAGSRQDLFAIRSGLSIEPSKARNAHDARARPELLGRLERVL